MEHNVNQSLMLRPRLDFNICILHSDCINPFHFIHGLIHHMQFCKVNIISDQHQYEDVKTYLSVYIKNPTKETLIAYINSIISKKQTDLEQYVQKRYSIPPDINVFVHIGNYRMYLEYILLQIHESKLLSDQEASTFITRIANLRNTEPYYNSTILITSNEDTCVPTLNTIYKNYTDIPKSHDEVKLDIDGSQINTKTVIHSAIYVYDTLLETLRISQNSKQSIIFSKPRMQMMCTYLSYLKTQSQ
jgi:hypothetical protein